MPAVLLSIALLVTIALLVSLALLMSMGVVVVLNLFLEVNRVVALYGVWNLLEQRNLNLLVHGVRFVNGYLDFIGDGLLYSVRDLLVYIIRFRYGDLNVDWVRFLNLNLVRFVDWYFNFIGYWFVYSHGVRFLNSYGVGLLNVYVVRFVNWYFDFVRDLLDDFVRLGYLDFVFDRVRHLLFNGVRLWIGDLDFIGDLLFNGVWGGDLNFHFVRLVNVDLDFIRYLFLNCVGFGYVYRVLHVLLNSHGYFFLNGVRLGVGYFHFVRYFLLNSVGDVFFNGVWDRYLLDDFNMLYVLMMAVTMAVISTAST